MESAMDCSAIEAAIRELRDVLGDKVSTSEAVRGHHGHDESWHQPALPDAVVFAHTTQDVVRAVTLCASHKVPVIPFGTGSAMEGSVNALRGGVSIDTSHMSTILAVNAGDMDCQVEAGVTREALNAHLRDTGLFFPVDPGANASIGGMAATRASGTTTVRYGSMRENVIGLEAVLANGSVIQTGGRVRKSSSGYDLTKLLVGSEGTLGVITKVRLRLHPVPEAILAMTATFPSVEHAISATCDLMKAGLPIARAEFLDELEMTAINTYCGETFPVLPTLFYEFHGPNSIVEETADIAESVFLEYQAGSIDRATTPEKRNRIWSARHSIAFAERTLRPGADLFVTDVVVPISNLPEVIRRARIDLEKVDLVAPLSGHVGDGNIHFVLLVDRSDKQELETAEWFHERLIENAVDLEGSITGEHGIGQGKARFLEKEHGQSVAAMKAIKQALDPDGLLNPGKIFIEP